jgi:hypothetical protein
VLQYFALPSREKLLPDVETFYPEGYAPPKYVLVMELNGVLVSPEWTVGLAHFKGYHILISAALVYNWLAIQVASGCKEFH